MHNLFSIETHTCMATELQYLIHSSKVCMPKFKCWSVSFRNLGSPDWKGHSWPLRHGTEPTWGDHQRNNPKSIRKPLDIGTKLNMQKCISWPFEKVHMYMCIAARSSAHQPAGNTHIWLPNTAQVSLVHCTVAIFILTRFIIKATPFALLD